MFRINSSDHLATAAMQMHTPVPARSQMPPDSDTASMTSTTSSGRRTPPRSNARHTMGLEGDQFSKKKAAQTKKPTTGATSGRDLFAMLPYEIIVQIMKEIGPSTFRNAQLGTRYRKILYERVKAIIFPHLESWKNEMLADLLDIQEMDTLDGITLEPHRYTDAQEMIEMVCKNMTLLAAMGDSCFVPGQEHLLRTRDGFEAANAYYQFLNRFGDQHGAAVHDGAMISDLYVAFEECAFLRMLKQDDAISDDGLAQDDLMHAEPEQRVTHEEMEQARRGLLRFLNSLCCHERRFNGSVSESYAFTTTLEAYETGHQPLMAFIDAPGSRWYDKDFPRYYTIKAVAVGNPEFDAWMLKENSPWHSMEGWPADHTTDAIRLNNKEFSAWIMQENSPWLSLPSEFHRPFGRDESLTEQSAMVEAVQIGNPAFTNWILQKNSPWLAMPFDERVLTIDMIKRGDPEINAWIMQQDSPWLSMNMYQMHNTHKAIATGIPAVKEMVMHQSAFWCDILNGNVEDAQTYMLSDHLLETLDKINTSFTDVDKKNRLVKTMLRKEGYWFDIRIGDRHPVMHALEHQREDLLALYFGDSNLRDRQRRIGGENFVETTGSISQIGNATADRYLTSRSGYWPKDNKFRHYREDTQKAMSAIFSEKNQTRIPDDLKEKLVHFLFDKKGAWRAVAEPFAAAWGRDVTLKPFNGHYSYFYKGPADILVRCMKSGNLRVINWILKEQRQLPGMRTEQVYALALAARSDNQRFFNFVTRPRSQAGKMSANGITALHDLFEQAGTDPNSAALVAKIEADPSILEKFSSSDIKMATKYATFNPDMIAFARAHDAVLSTWHAGKVARTQEALDLHNRLLTRYILRGGETWNTMSEEQMVQTIRAFKTGNASLIGKIVDNRKDEHWHRLPPERMAEINHVMETGSGPRRIKARHGKWV